MSTMKTAGDLRMFLAGVLEGIKDGTVDAAQATSISKVSAQINQSLQVEVSTKLAMIAQTNATRPPTKQPFPIHRSLPQRLCAYRRTHRAS